MFSKLSTFLLLGSITATPVAAFALPHTGFIVKAGTAADALPNGTVPQAVITLIMSNSPTACEDLQSVTFKPNKQYLVSRLSAFATGDGLTGCYQNGTETDGDACQAQRGAFTGVDFTATAKEENAGRLKNARFVTGGHIQVDEITFNEDGTGRLTGFANVRLGDIATGGVLDADRCAPPASELQARAPVIYETRDPDAANDLPCYRLTLGRMHQEDGAPAINGVYRGSEFFLRAPNGNDCTHLVGEATYDDEHSFFVELTMDDACRTPKSFRTELKARHEPAGESYGTAVCNKLRRYRDTPQRD